MRKRERYPVQVDRNDHEKLKFLAEGTGLSLGTIIHKALKVVTEKIKASNDIPKGIKLPAFFVFELLDWDLQGPEHGFNIEVNK